MYILVRENVEQDKAIVSVAHASLACHLKFQGNEEYMDWLQNSFKKVVCMVNDKEFDKAKAFEDNIVITESSLDNEEMCIVFKPRSEWPKPFSFYRLYKRSNLK